MNKKKKVKPIIKGYFYHVHEGSKTGHPGFVYWKSDRKNLYLLITTGTSGGENFIKLTYPISENIITSFVYRRPLLAKRKNIGGLRQNLSFNKTDKWVVKRISREPFRATKDIKRKDKRYLKRLKKYPKY